MTKALHRKRPALIPMLDSVVQAYLTRDDPGTGSSASFGERATALVRSYKETWIATAWSCARSSKNSRAAGARSPRCEYSTS
jgi:hypothetical protein